VSENAPVSDHRRCILSVSGGEVELAGPPATRRAFGELLRRRAESFPAVLPQLASLTFTTGAYAQLRTVPGLLAAERALDHVAPLARAAVPAGGKYMTIG
jgi:hypothetical protein